jgi:hypothetical protein
MMVKVMNAVIEMRKNARKDFPQKRKRMLNKENDAKRLTLSKRTEKN